MKKRKERRKPISGFPLAFAILAILFLFVGISSLGTARSTGESYELKKGTSVVFRLDAQEEQKSLKEIYLNIGTVYQEIGTTAEIRIRRASSAAQSWFTSYLGTAKIDNLISSSDGNERGGTFNWIAPYDLSQATFTLAAYPCYQLEATSCNLLINEIVFVGDDGNPVPATVDADASNGINATRAAALIDAQRVPPVSQSSFFRFGEEEAYSLMTVAEMRAGRAYTEGNVYHIDATYNALGFDLLCLGTLVFGMSPFGLRIFPFLASFGCLIAGYFLTKRLFRSERAGFLFGLLYALSGLTLTVGRLGTPFLIGLFFWLVSVDAAHRFYANGLARARVRDGLPLLVSGLFAALSVCVHGAFAVPVVGTVGLFVAGMVRQGKAKSYYLAKAETAAEGAVADAETTAEERRAAVKAEFRYKNVMAAALFWAGLIAGGILVSVLAFLPVYPTFVKAYDNPAAPIADLFSLVWKGFAGGFVGTNALSSQQSAWKLAYNLFVGSGDLYARTIASVNYVAAAAAIAGIVVSLVRVAVALFGKLGEKTARQELRAALVPLAAVALLLVTASFASFGVGFVTAAYVAAFMAAAGQTRLIRSETAYTATVTTVSVLLAVYFVLLIPFVFSVPLPAEWFVKLFG